MTKVFVVVVTYNGAKWVDYCFGSLSKSSIPIETVVVDNGSEDDTVEKIRSSYPSVHVIESHSNLGFGKGNNRGIEYALSNGAEYVFLLNQDAKIEPDTIEKLVQKQSENPEIGVLSPIHLNGDGSDLDFKFCKFHMRPDKCEGLIGDIYLDRDTDKIYGAKTLNAAAWLISKPCLKKVGGFHPLFDHYGEDDNYLQRVFYSGFNVGIYPETVIYHDRDDRSDNSYFISYKSRKRDLLKELTNPNVENRQSVLRNKLRWYFFSSIVRFNINQVRENYRLLKDFKRFTEKLRALNSEKNKAYPYLNSDNVA